MNRADEGEGREPGVLMTVDPLMALYLDAKACAETAEAEVARLTAALTEAERERDEAKSKVAEMRRDWRHGKRLRDLLRVEIAGTSEARDAARRHHMAAEASASALRERVATLEAALKPFATYAADMPGADFGEGEIGEYYHDGFRRSICTQDLRAARTALEVPHDDK